MNIGHINTKFMDSKKLKILLAIIVALCIGQFSYAQNPNELNLIVQQATTAAQNNDFTTAKQNYDALFRLLRNNRILI